MGLFTKNIITAAIGGIFWASSSFAACTGPGAEAVFSESELEAIKAETAAIPYSDGIYWRAQKDDKQVLVAGTIHVFDPRLSETLARFQPDLESTDLLMLEMTMDKQIEMQNILATTPDIFLLPDGQVMADVLEPDTWAEVSGAVSSLGINPADVANLQPWFLSLNLLLAPCAVALLQADEPGMEELIEDALPAETPRVSLEEWQDALKFFTDADYETQAEELVMTLATYHLADPMTVATVDAYFNGDPMLVWTMTQKLRSHIPDEMQASYDIYMDRLETDLLALRNEAWIERIEAAALDHDSIFVAVGAMHLAHEFGILHLLEDNGWDVSPMP